MSWSFEERWQGGLETPRALLAIHEENVCVWNLTPLRRRGVGVANAHSVLVYCEPTTGGLYPQ